MVKLPKNNSVLIPQTHMDTLLPALCLLIRTLKTALRTHVISLKPRVDGVDEGRALLLHTAPEARARARHQAFSRQGQPRPCPCLKPGGWQAQGPDSPSPFSLPITALDVQMCVC